MPPNLTPSSAWCSGSKASSWAWRGRVGIYSALVFPRPSLSAARYPCPGIHAFSSTLSSSPAPAGMSECGQLGNQSMISCHSATMVPNSCSSTRPRSRNSRPFCRAASGSVRPSCANCFFSLLSASMSRCSFCRAASRSNQRSTLALAGSTFRTRIASRMASGLERTAFASIIMLALCFGSKKD